MAIYTKVDSVKGHTIYEGDGHFAVVADDNDVECQTFDTLKEAYDYCEKEND